MGRRGIRASLRALFGFLGTPVVEAGREGRIGLPER
jgi:hypothetical protein